MQFVNRLLATLGLLLLILAVTALLVAPRWVAEVAARLIPATFLAQVAQVVMALVVDALLLLAIYRLWRRGRGGLIVRARGAKAQVSIDSVQREIVTRIEEVPDVIGVQALVEDEWGKARVSLRVQARPDINIPEKQREISRVLHQLVEKQMGLRLSSAPSIHIGLVKEAGERIEEAVLVEASVAESPLSAARTEPSLYALQAPRQAEAQTPYLVALEPPDADETAGPETSPEPSAAAEES